MFRPAAREPVGAEHCVELRSRDDWQQFWTGTDELRNPKFVHSVAKAIAGNGFEFEGRKLAPREFRYDPPNYRESFVHSGLNSRHRAVLEEFYKRSSDRHANDLAIYAPEAVTEFALYLRGRYPRFIGSEFTRDPAIAKKLAPIPVEDLGKLSFDDEVFDFVLVNDVFEHVPHLSKVLAEIARVLKPGGSLVSTFPFDVNEQDHAVKAKLVNGRVRHLTEPEYHGDPVNPKGALVFQIPGWQVIADCKRQGFEDASMVFSLSESRGILSADVGGIFVLVATK